MIILWASLLYCSGFSVWAATRIGGDGPKDGPRWWSVLCRLVFWPAYITNLAGCMVILAELREML